MFALGELSEKSFQTGVDYTINLHGDTFSVAGRALKDIRKTERFKISKYQINSMCHAYNIKQYVYIGEKSINNFKLYETIILVHKL